MFQFWDIVMRLELAVLIFVRAHREANFHLYVAALNYLVPWFFAMDHGHYARWTPVHIEDMQNLLISVLDEFEHRGQWVVHKSGKRFSAVPNDKAHENNNGAVKGCGGAIGLTQNPSALQRWVLSGPEQSRLLAEFEKEDTQEQKNHHEEGFSFQKSFKADVERLTATIKEMGNPFMTADEDVVRLDTRDVMPEEVARSIRSIESLGTEQYQAFRQDVLISRTKSIHAPLKRNSLSLFKATKTGVRKQTKIQNLKQDVSVFAPFHRITAARSKSWRFLLT
jgi:hypothetical protein